VLLLHQDTPLLAAGRFIFYWLKRYTFHYCSRSYMF
jgi:hypothetical protein